MYQSIPHRIKVISDEFPSNTICYTKNKENKYAKITYSQFMSDMYRSTYFLQKKCKVVKGNRIGIISENRKEWLELDLAILSLRACDVPRGTDTNVAEIAFILEHAEVKGVIFEKSSNYQALLKYKPYLCKKFSFVIFLETPPKSFYNKIKATITTQNIKKDNTYFYTYEDITKTTLNTKESSAIKRKLLSVKPDDIATIMYTSGTTHPPNGACLSHNNIMFQIDRICPEIISVGFTTKLLAILPIWHILERAVNYIIICRGGSLAYSTPVEAIFLEDIKMIHPTHVTSVPRIWESIYTAIHKKIEQGSSIKKFLFNLACLVGRAFNYATHLKNNTIPSFSPRSLFIDKLIGIPLYFLLFLPHLLLDTLVFKKIRNLLGTHFTAGILGGGYFMQKIDRFFQSIGIKILNVYGLTETAPIISVRNEYTTELSGAGKFLRDILYKVTNEKGDIVPIGETGILYIKSDQIMKGYYKNKKATLEVIDKEGWFNTGDIIRVSEERDLDIIGRRKNIIILTNGKNIDPESIECMICQSEYINNAMLIGQNQKQLSALIVPEHETILKYIQQKNMTDISSKPSIEKLYKKQEILSLINEEITRLTSHVNQYEKIGRFVLVSTPFTVGKELTQTLKLKRFYIQEQYKKEISTLTDKQ